MFRRIVILAILGVAACGARTVEQHVAYGELALENGRYGRAIESFHRALRLAPDRPDLLVHLAEARVGRREIDQARRLLLRALGGDPGNRRAALLLVSSSLTAGRFDEAVASARDLARGGTDPALARTLLAEALDRRAAARIRDLVVEARRRPGLRDLLGFLARLGRGDLDGARSFLRTAAAPETAAALLPGLDAARADRVAALASVRDALRRDPRLVRARVLRAGMLLSAGRPVAEGDLEAAARDAKDPDLAVRALSLLAAARERAGDGPGAREAADRMVAFAPRNRAARLQRALLRIRTGDLSAALEDARAFESGRRGSPLAAWVEGMVRLLRGDARGACPLLGRAARIEGDPGPHLWLGLALMADGKPDLAVESIERALDLDPLLLPARLARAELALVRGDPERAVPAAEEVLRIEPRSAPALVLLARAHLAGAEHRAAGPEAREAERGRAREALGRAAALIHDSPAALPPADGALSEALRVRPGDPIVLSARVAFLRAAGREEEAVAPLTALFDAAPDDPEGIDLGLLLSETGNAAQAVEVAREAVRRFPDSAPALVSLAVVEGRLAPEEARAAAERAADLAGGSPLPAVLLADLRLEAGDPGGAADAVLARKGLGTVARRAVLWSAEATAGRGGGDGDAGWEARDRAIAWHLTGRWPERAERWAETALAGNPHDTVSLGILAASRIARGDAEGAVQAWRLLVHHDPDAARAAPRAFLRLGLSAGRRGEEEQAILYYEEALRYDPASVPAANNLGVLYAKRSEHLDRAEELARRAVRLSGGHPATLDTLATIERLRR